MRVTYIANPMKAVNLDASMQTKYKSIVLMGQAGSGKGTQSTGLAERFGYKIFSTGDKAREIAAQDTPLGRTIANIHTTGWIPEWLASYLMTRALLDDFFDKGLVFESVARKLEEARKLHEIHITLERQYIVVYLAVDESVTTTRMLERGRSDYDTEVKIQKRISAFKSETMESIDFFKKQGTLKEVDANGSEDEVFTEILSHIT